MSKFPDRDFNRLQYLCALLAAVKAILEMYLVMPISKHHTLTVPMTLQVIWNTGTLQQLSAFEHPDWDKSLVSEAMDIVDFLKRLCHTLRMVKSALGYDSHTSEGLDFWSQGARSMSMVESFFEGKTPNPEHENGDSPVPNLTDIETPNFSTFPPGVEFMDFMDDVWMGPSDYQRW